MNVFGGSTFQSWKPKAFWGDKVFEVEYLKDYMERIFENDLKKKAYHDTF